MQPKPIDSRRLIDIDLQKRIVDMEGMQQPRSVSGHKEHPAETDYDVTHDEDGRRNSEQAAEQFSERIKRLKAKSPKKPVKSTEDETSNDQPVPQNGKGSHLDIEA